MIENVNVTLKITVGDICSIAGLGKTIKEKEGNITLTSTNMLQAADVSILDLDICKSNFSYSQIKMSSKQLMGSIELNIKVRDHNICVKYIGKSRISVVCLHRYTESVMKSFYVTRVILEDHWCAQTRKTKKC